MTEFEKQMLEQMKAMNTRFDGIDTWLDGMDKRMGDITDEMKAGFRNINERQAQIDRKSTRLNSSH